MRRPPYPIPQEQVEEIERQNQECSDAGLVEQCKTGDYLHHCSPCLPVAKPGSTVLRLVVDYDEVNKEAQNHSGSIPNIGNTLERIAKCRYKTQMDKRSGFWQVDLTAAAQELLAFITPKGLVSKWKVMPIGVAKTPPRTRTCACSYLFACSYFLRVLISETLRPVGSNRVKIINSWHASRGWPMQKLGTCHMRKASGKSLKIPGMPAEANRC